MRRAEKVHLLPFGDGGVLLDESAQKLFISTPAPRLSGAS